MWWSFAFFGSRLCVQQKFFCSDWCVIHIVYAHFPIHNLSNSSFSALCVLIALFPVCLPTTLVSCVFNAECTNKSFSVYCKLPQSLVFFLSQFGKKAPKLAHHPRSLVCSQFTASTLHQPGPDGEWFLSSGRNGSGTSKFRYWDRMGRVVRKC